MIMEINGQLTFCYGCPRVKKTYRFKYAGPLLVALIGVFLLPLAAYTFEITPEKIIELTNQERLKTDLNPLTANQLLTQAAYNKGQAILESGDFQHNINDKKFSDWIKETGYKYSYVGENLAIDFNTSEGIISAWLASDLHKKNLLSPHYDEIGIAVLEGEFDGQNTMIVTQIFGAPPKNVAQPKVMGINNQNYLTAQAKPPFSYSQQPENFLTHAILSPTPTQPSLNINSPYLLPAGNNNLNKVSNFFAQHSPLIINDLFAAIITALAALSMAYIYFFCFSRLLKNIHLS